MSALKPTKAAKRELLSLYAAAEHHIRDQLTKAVLTDYQHFRLREQLAQVEGIVAALSAKVAEVSGPMAGAYYREGADLASSALAAQGVDVTALNMGNLIHSRGVQAIADQMALDLALANDSIRQTATRVLRQTQQKALEERQINKLLADGLITGETERKTTRQLTKALVEAVTEGKLVKAGGRTFTPGYYAEMVVRTRTREAVTAGTVARGMELGVTLYQVSIHDDSCPACLEYQGKVFSVVEDERFPRLERRPPYHPNCEHSLVPYVPVPGKEDELEALARISRSKHPVEPGEPGALEALALEKRLTETAAA